MIDADGFRLNVGIILMNRVGRLFWAKRVGQEDAWQFPQGGIKKYETTEDALYRELAEEIGLSKDDVEIVACSKVWLKYRLPHKYIRYTSRPLCIGQKQRWYLLRLLSPEDRVSLTQCQKPEFDCFRWVSYWHPLQEVVAFKKDVYRLALEEFAELLSPEAIN